MKGGEMMHGLETIKKKNNEAQEKWDRKQEGMSLFELAGFFGKFSTDLRFEITALITELADRQEMAWKGDKEAKTRKIEVNVPVEVCNSLQTYLKTKKQQVAFFSMLLGYGILAKDKAIDEEFKG
jgi:hypothetical protein